MTVKFFNIEQECKLTNSERYIFKIYLRSYAISNKKISSDKP